MKKTIYIITFIIISCQVSCSIETEEKQEKEIETSFADEIFDESLYEHGDIGMEDDDFYLYEENWKHLLSSLINEEVEFDWNQFVEIEGQTGEDYQYLFEDEYTKNELTQTSYQDLENSEFMGEATKKFTVAVSDGAGNMVGSIFHFAERKKGLKLIGYESF